MTAASASSSSNNDLWAKLVNVLDDPSFKLLSDGFDRTGLMERANAISKGNGLRMLLLPSDTIDLLGRIPRSSEGEAVDAVETIESIGTATCEVFMVSHKWLRSRTDPMDATTGYPDTPTNYKAKLYVNLPNGESRG